MSQNFDLGPSYIFMVCSVNNNEENMSEIFYITYKINQDLNQNCEKIFSRGDCKKHMTPN